MSTLLPLAGVGMTLACLLLLMDHPGTAWKKYFVNKIIGGLQEISDKILSEYRLSGGRCMSWIDMSLTLFSAIIHDYKFIDIAMMLLLHTQIHITHCSTKEIFISLYCLWMLEIECLFLMIRNVVPFELNKYISHMFISCHVGTINKTKIFRIIFRFFKNLSSVSANQRRVYI